MSKQPSLPGGGYWILHEQPNRGHAKRPQHWKTRNVELSISISQMGTPNGYPKSFKSLNHDFVLKPLVMTIRISRQRRLGCQGEEGWNTMHRSFCMNKQHEIDEIEHDRKLDGSCADMNTCFPIRRGCTIFRFPLLLVKRTTDPNSWFQHSHDSLHMIHDARASMFFWLLFQDESPQIIAVLFGITCLPSACPCSERDARSLM